MDGDATVNALLVKASQTKKENVQTLFDCHHFVCLPTNHKTLGDGVNMLRSALDYECEHKSEWFHKKNNSNCCWLQGLEYTNILKR